MWTARGVDGRRFGPQIPELLVSSLAGGERERAEPQSFVDYGGALTSLRCSWLPWTIARLRQRRAGRLQPRIFAPRLPPCERCPRPSYYSRHPSFQPWRHRGVWFKCLLLTERRGLGRGSGVERGGGGRRAGERASEQARAAQNTER
jgi:hypothetical protein